jgi:hypothetical protein
MHQRTSAYWIALFLLGSGVVQVEASVEEARANLEQWVQARQLTSRLKSDWREEKEMLDQTAALFEREFEELNAQLAKAQTGTSQVDRDREALQAEQQELTEAENRAAEYVTQFEQRIRTLSGAFPPPLSERLEPLMKRLPEDPSNTRLKPVERLQNLVGILNEVDKFNGTISVESGLQRRPSGEEIQVKTLYLGLGQAYFTDQTGGFAGVGVPSLKGWEWTPQPGLGAGVLRAIAEYENARPPAFEALPMVVQ